MRRRGVFVSGLRDGILLDLLVKATIEQAAK